MTPQFGVPAPANPFDTTGDSFPTCTSGGETSTAPAAATAPTAGRRLGAVLIDTSI